MIHLGMSANGSFRAARPYHLSRKPTSLEREKTFSWNVPRKHPWRIAVGFSIRDLVAARARYAVARSYWSGPSVASYVGDRPLAVLVQEGLLWARSIRPNQPACARFQGTDQIGA